MPVTNKKTIQEINSVWTQELGRWDDLKNEYTDRKKRTKEKVLTMEIVHQIGSSRDPVLMFNGGPTGYESYYLEDLRNGLSDERNENEDKLCICGGTINRWPECIVSAKEVLKFIQEYTL